MKKLFLILMLAVLAGCGNGEQNHQSATDIKNFPIEQKFVIVGAGHFVAADDPSVSRARELLNRAAASYGMPLDAVADQAYTAHTVAKGDGIQATAMEVLEAATLAFVPNSGMQFASSCAMYVTLRKSGMPHAEAMMGMKGLVQKVKELGDASRK